MQNNFSCDHQGRADVVRHCDRPAHENMASVVKSSKTITDMLKLANSASYSALKDQTLIENTGKIELTHVNFIFKHNLSFRTSNHKSHTYPIMFPDSKIVKKFA